jgi:transcriptional regulator NrdR family protein
MKCPVCGKKTKVRDSRLHKSGYKRYRECLSCHAYFTTYEKVDLESLWEVVE